MFNKDNGTIVNELQSHGDYDNLEAIIDSDECHEVLKTVFIYMTIGALRLYRMFLKLRRKLGL